MATSPRALVTRWVVPIAVVGILALVVALAGGFRDARGDAGPAAQPGEEIALARWRITVHEVELVNTTLTGAETSNELRVHLTVTFIGDESVFALPSGLVSVVVPEGPRPETGYAVSDVWSSQLDPHVTRSYVLDHTWPPLDEDVEQPAITTVPETVSVVVRDEVYAEGALFGWSWGVDDVAAVVTVPLTDNRVTS